MPAPLPILVSWPLGGADARGRIDYARDNLSVREVIWNILLTRPGERLMRPDFGAGLHDFVHQPNNETTRSLMADVVRRAIERWEPRIELLAVDVLPDAEALAQVNLSIRYRLRGSGASDSLHLALDLGP